MHPEPSCPWDQLLLSHLSQAKGGKPAWAAEEFCLSSTFVDFKARGCFFKDRTRYPCWWALASQRAGGNEEGVLPGIMCHHRTGHPRRQLLQLFLSSLEPTLTQPPPPRGPHSTCRAESGGPLCWSRYAPQTLGLHREAGGLPTLLPCCRNQWNNRREFLVWRLTLCWN